MTMLIGYDNILALVPARGNVIDSAGQFGY